MKSPIEPSETDTFFLKIIRDNVNTFLHHAAMNYVDSKQALLLDIAPQDHEGARPFFPSWIMIDTLDIDPLSKCTYIADICNRNDKQISDNHYDYVVCTEVLEHTLQPFNAIKEIERILKPTGKLFLSVPFNFRIHGPLPDCWRFTEHGIKAILSDYEIIELNCIDTEDRPLMPIHYTVVAQKK